MLTRFNKNSKARTFPGIDLGYVIIPKDVDRENFISMCIKSSTILITTKNGEQYENVPVGKSLFNDIIFPIKNTETGSPIVFGFLRSTNWPTVVSILSGTGELLSHSEDSFRLNRNKDGKSVSIVGNSEIGNISIKATTNEKGRVSLSIDGDENSELIVSSTGKVKIAGDLIYTYSKREILTRVKSLEQDPETIIRYLLGEGFTFKDEFGNEIILTDDSFTSKFKKYKIQNKNNYSLKKLFDEIIDEISNITTSTSLGQMPVLNKVQIIALKNKVSQILE